MCDNNEIKELIEKNVRLYGRCLQEVVNYIPKEIKATSENEVEIEVSKEMYKDIATSIFIETNKNISRLEKEDDPASNAQKAYIMGLIEKKGKKGELWIEKYLDFNKIEKIEKLTKEQASDILTELKKL